MDMNKYKRIQIICWSIVFVVFVGLAVWFVSDIGFNGGIINKGIISENLSGPYHEEGRYTLDSADIKSMDIDWVSGSVKVIPHDNSSITLVEYAQRELDADEMMVYNISSDTLKVKFRNNNKLFDNIPPKKLEVFIPIELAGSFSEFEISSVSAPVDVRDITSGEFKINSVSGPCEAYTIHADNIKISTTSGNITLTESTSGDISMNSVSGKVSVNKVSAEYIGIHTTSGDAVAKDANFSNVSSSTVSGGFDFDGEFESIQTNSTSGKVKINDGIVPGGLDISTVSGDIHVAMPKADDIQIKYSTISGRFSCDFPVVMKNSGSDYVFSTGSGDITIKEN